MKLIPLFLVTFASANLEYCVKNQKQKQKSLLLEKLGGNIIINQQRPFSLPNLWLLHWRQHEEVFIGFHSC
jgi:hypothetical protein